MTLYAWPWWSDYVIAAGFYAISAICAWNLVLETLDFRDWLHSRGK